MRTCSGACELPTEIGDRTMRRALDPCGFFVIAAVLSFIADYTQAQCDWIHNCGAPPSSVPLCGPPARVYHGLAYAGNGTVVMHGGQPSLEDTWLWNGSTWTQ